MVLQRAFFILLLCVVATQALSIVTPIRSLDRFNHTIINEPLVVAYLYNAEGTKEYRQERKRQIANNHAVLRALSRDGRYQAAGINFIQANLSKNNLCDLQQTYHLNDEDSLLLFDREKSVDKVLTGKFNRADVEDLIEGQWKKKIDIMLKQQAEERRERRADMQARALTWGTGPYWCWPYGFGGCGANGCWGGPCRGYVGFNVGFGGCC